MTITKNRVATTENYFKYNIFENVTTPIALNLLVEKLLSHFLFFLESGARSVWYFYSKPPLGCTSGALLYEVLNRMLSDLSRIDGEYNTSLNRGVADDRCLKSA